MTEVTEYKPKFEVGTKVEFNFNGSRYKGVVSNVWIKNGAKDDNAVTYDILSNNIHFQKHENDIALYNSSPDTVAFTSIIGNRTRFIVGDEAPLEEGETFSTESGNDFSIFRHYEDDEDGNPLIHIELSENDIWSKDDVWELVAELLNAVDEIDKYTESKPPIVFNVAHAINNKELSDDIKKMIYEVFRQEHSRPRYAV